MLNFKPQVDKVKMGQTIGEFIIIIPNFYKTLPFLILFSLVYLMFFMLLKERDIKGKRKYLFTLVFNKGK